MSLLARAGGMFSFTHLSGLGAKKRAEDKKPEEREEDENESRRAEEDQPEHYEDDGKGKKSDKAEDNDGDEDEDEGRETAAALGAAKPAAEKEPDDDVEDDDDEEMKKAKAAGHGAAFRAARRQGRLAERRRVGRILSSKAAEGRIAAAAHLACNTGLSSAEAVGLLAIVPAEPKKGGVLAAAMDRQAKPGLASADGGQALTPGQALIASARDFAKTLAAKKR